ncbi:unnamed protein product [Diamesa tonsa]
MFWILRRTGAANFFNSMNNNYSSKNTSNNTNNPADKNTSWQRFRYGRLSVESDDQNTSNKKCDVSNDLLVDNDIDNVFCHSNYDNSKSQNLDNNGNEKDYLNENDNNNFFANEPDLELDNHTKKNRIKSQSTNQIDHNTINRIQAMAMSDDDDYDESLTCNVCDRAFHCHRQLASHQQKKRHFGCSGCDTLFPSLMLLEHHKEEYEHWSESEEDRHQHCCRRNRRNDYDYTDTETGTSDAESEDLERLL